MSIDIKIQNKCDHLINWEEGILQSDRRSIYVTYPIAATASMKLRINWIDVPASEYVTKTRPLYGVVDPPLYIEMRNKIKAYDPQIEVQYNTVAQYCPKCRGVRVLDDLVYTRDGNIRTVKDEALLIQNVEKYIVTKQTSNIFHKWLGTDLHNMIGSKIVDLDLLRSEVIEQINSAINKLQNVQRQALGADLDLSDGELFGKLITIDIERTDDPTVVLATAVFTAQSGRPLEYNQLIELQLARERRAFI